MNADEASRVSELARSLYEHRLAGSMEDALAMAHRMINGEAPKEYVSKEERYEQSKKPNPQSSELPSTASVEVHDTEEVTTVEENSKQDTLATPSANPSTLDQEIKSLHLSEEANESQLAQVNQEISHFKEELNENAQELAEIKACLADIEKLVEDSEEAAKKEEAGVKVSELAEKETDESS